jgi:hypothetical protein
MSAGNVFIIGYSGSGKSTLAARIAALRDMRCISAGGWTREWYLGGCEAAADYREELAAYAVAVLRGAPLTAVEWITARMGERPAVIEGVRNPADFVRLFDAQRDEVRHLVHRRPTVQPTTFDRGVDVIAAHLRWMIATHLVEPWRYEVQEFDTYEEISAC